MKINWKKLFGGIGKAAEVAAPIVATKSTTIGKALEIGAEAAKQATKEEPKK